jgi:alkanesulfonate monooxygenase SsuD/methylene tetrahydromethanopterin reductase-like flavin-dependent oxidoreductase (luciferase family)
VTDVPSAARRRPEIGLLLPTRQGGAFDRATVEDTLALAVRAETRGLDSVWAGESILARPRFEPLVLLAAVAARTRRVRLGTATMLPALHPPVVLAQRLATLDCVAGGRLVVGAGIGIDAPATRAEFDAAGARFDQRVGRLVETVRACRSLWSSAPEAASDDAPGRLTRYWDLRGVALEPKPFREGGPPFWIGSTFSREAALVRAGRVFDGWMPTAPNAAAFASGWAQVLAAADAAGRSRAALTPAVYLTVSLDRDPARAEARLGSYVSSYYGLPFDVMRKVQGMFAGTPEACAEWLLEFARAGAAHLVLRSPDLPADLDPIAEVILPRLEASA